MVYTLNILHLFDITSFILFYQNNIILPINEIQLHTILTTLFYVSIIHRSRKVKCHGEQSEIKPFKNKIVITLSIENIIIQEQNIKNNFYSFLSIFLI